MNKIRKSPVQIKLEILEYLYYTPDSTLRTYLWRKATDLSYDDFLKYMSRLEEKKLVMETGDGYTITKEGRKVYLRLKEILPILL